MLSLLKFLILLCLIKKYGINAKTTDDSPKPRQPPNYYQGPGNATPIYVDNKYNKSILQRTFSHINTSTCLTFVLQNNTVNNTIGINFLISNSSENKVELSNSSTSPTNVYLKENDAKNETILNLFVGLALDLVTEVRRPDREIDVHVNMSNVLENFTQYYNITPLSEITYLNDTNFDFESPMFFGSDFGSKNRQPTYKVILYKDYQYIFRFGKPFRHNDYKHLYYYYCNGSTRRNDCMYGGYPYSKGNNICKCPKQFTGPRCEMFNNQSRRFYNYTIEGPFEANSTRTYYSVALYNTTFYLNITSKSEKNVSVTIENLMFNRTNCTFSGSRLEALVRQDKGAAGIQLCRNSTNITLPPLSNQVFLTLKVKKEHTFLNISFMEYNNKTKDSDTESSSTTSTKSSKKGEKQEKNEDKSILFNALDLFGTSLAKALDKWLPWRN